jgi:hypothetical protein
MIPNIGANEAKRQLINMMRDTLESGHCNFMTKISKQKERKSCRGLKSREKEYATKKTNISSPSSCPGLNKVLAWRDITLTWKNVVGI